MSETRRDREIAKEQAARRIGRKLILWLIFLITILVTLIFRLGEASWPLWLVDYRLRVVAFFLLITIGTLVLTPLLIEYSKDPRPLSGPGKSPYSGG